MKKKAHQLFPCPFVRARAVSIEDAYCHNISMQIDAKKYAIQWLVRTSHVLRMSFVILIAEEYDAYIIVSFVNATLVLSIGETVEEVTDSGFLGTTPTLSCSALGEDALVQVHQS